jgi:predicted DNA binding CopG/RHH family protein
MSQVATRKKLPAFKADKEAEDFLDRDLSDYIHAGNFAPFVFEYQPKQKCIRQALEAAVRKRSRA